MAAARWAVVAALVVLAAVCGVSAHETAHDTARSTRFARNRQSGVFDRVSNAFNRHVVQPVSRATTVVKEILNPPREDVPDTPGLLVEELAHFACGASITAYYPQESQPGDPFHLNSCAGPRSVQFLSLRSASTGADGQVIRVVVNLKSHGKKRGIVFAMRGTDKASKQDILASLRSVFKQQMRIQGPSQGYLGKASGLCTDCGKAAKGFYKQTLKLRALLYQSGQPRDLMNSCLVEGAPNNKMGPCDFVLFTGHSLGGATAQMLALDGVLNGVIPGDKAFIITFGAPRVGDKQFGKKLKSLVPEGNVRLFVGHNPEGHAMLPGVLEQDPVPTLPPRVMGFEHAYPLTYVVPAERWKELKVSQVMQFRLHRAQSYNSALRLKPSRYGFFACSHDLDGKVVKQRPMVQACHAFNAPKAVELENGDPATASAMAEGMQESKGRFVVRAFVGHNADLYTAKTTKSAPRRAFVGPRRCKNFRHCESGSAKHPCKTTGDVKMDLFCLDGACKCMELFKTAAMPFDCEVVKYDLT